MGFLSRFSKAKKLAEQAQGRVNQAQSGEIEVPSVDTDAAANEALKRANQASNKQTK